MAKTIGLIFPKEKKTNKDAGKKPEGKKPEGKKPEGGAPAQTPEQ